MSTWSTEIRWFACPLFFEISMKKRSTNAKHGGTLVIAGIMVMMLVIGELFLYTWSRVQCISTGYEITKLKKEHRRHLAFQKNLKIEIAHLKSPKRITGVAAGQSGLKMPAPEQIISIP